MLNSMIWHVSESEAEQTVLRWLQHRLPQAPKGYLQQLLRKGSIRCDDRPLLPEDRVWNGMSVRLPNSQRLLDMLKTPAVSRLILVETEAWVALNKPAGIPVHPTAQKDGRDLLSLLKAHYRQAQAPFKVAPAHRIDRGTSGVVLFGKGRKALAALGQAFTERTVQKTYIALVQGQLTQPLELGGLVQAKGTIKTARAAAQPLDTGSDYTLLQLTLDTGRTHQLRQQLAAAGLPIVGDRRYGRRDTPSHHPLCLHSWQLELPVEMQHAEGPSVIQAPLPDTLINRIRGCGLQVDGVV